LQTVSDVDIEIRLIESDVPNVIRDTYLTQNELHVKVGGYFLHPYLLKYTLSISILYNIEHLLVT